VKLFCGACYKWAGADAAWTEHRDFERTYRPPVPLAIRAVCGICGKVGEFSTSERALKAEGVVLPTRRIYHEAKRLDQILKVTDSYPTGATMAKIMEGIGLKEDRTRLLVARAKKLGLLTAHKEGQTSHYERVEG